MAEKSTQSWCFILPHEVLGRVYSQRGSSSQRKPQKSRVYIGTYAMVTRIKTIIRNLSKYPYLCWQEFEWLS
ncbi:hypothetical protein FGO68_gene17452 [Halteria grandinella]|uniref:Uncharacterized protein n=1 Tax=Halteria grandinella TaxID=5974 RepID=A0A8J8NHR8_HALGN|nr:hypothetical protein FGO68_gene17452 [Halteria grandinella]